MNRIRPFLKGKRKYRTIIYGGLPIIFLTAVTTDYIMYYLFDVTMLVPLGILPYLAAAPAYLITALTGLIAADSISGGKFLKADIRYGPILRIIVLALPIVYYIGLFLLFLLYCRYYRTKRIKAFRRTRGALTALWVLNALPVVLILLLNIIN